ncbi:hypothetical protein ABIA33_002044 [Streptacidiphilus sp. MAP12-16]
MVEESGISPRRVVSTVTEHPYGAPADDSPDPDAPWGRCPRCGRPLVRDELSLQSWPARVAMAGPPVCAVCTSEEVERYLEEWDS